ncbi:3HCDH_N domain-containing protein, partial [Cephalotus follicularis]
IPGITNRGLVPRRVNKVAILDGGLMGSGITTALILSNYPVILKEVNEKFLEAGIGRVRAESTRKGFYSYDDKRKASPDPELKDYVEKSRSISGVSIDPRLVKLSEKDIVEMILFPVVNEACRVFAEGISVKASDLDIAAVMAMGFPPYRVLNFHSQRKHGVWRIFQALCLLG